MNSKHPEISIIIVTRGRMTQLQECVESIGRSASFKVEIIVVDQTDLSEAREKTNTRNMRHMGITYIPTSLRGKSKGLNLAIRLSKGSILAFTDDDCIADHRWLAVIRETFRTHKNISGMFGKSLPFEPTMHGELLCPATLEVTKAYTLTGLNDVEKRGYGNNMAFRKDVFVQMGGFIPWLGPGSIASNGEDLDITLRALSRGLLLRYEPKSVIYHNRWLTFSQGQWQDLSYVSGAAAAYMVTALSGHWNILFYMGRDIFGEIKAIMSLIGDFHRSSLMYAGLLFFWFVWKMLARLWGVVVACLLVHIRHS